METAELNCFTSRRGRALWLAIIVVAPMLGCSPLGMNLPFDKDDLPMPDGGRVRASLGWITTKPGDAAATAPDGSIALEVVRKNGKPLWQQVRHFEGTDGTYGDSVLLDRTTLRPVATWRWTPKGTWRTNYNHRSVERLFTPRRGSSVRRVEMNEVEPYSALGAELVVSALPLSNGYKAQFPVAVDTSPRGWSWLKVTVMTEVNLVERPDVPAKSTWIVDCDVDGDRTRLWVAIDGRSVRKIQKLGPDNQVLGMIRRVLIGGPRKVASN